MYHKFEEGKDLIIEAVVGKLQHQLPKKQGALSSEFVRQFLSTVAIDDLRLWTIDDLYGAVANMWSLVQQRKPGETKIRIYNPDFECDGWQDTHTVVELICEDMPFIVDSLRIVCRRLKIASHLIIHMGGIKLKRNAKGDITEILPRQNALADDIKVDAPIWMEIDRQASSSDIAALQEQFEDALCDTRAVVEDWQTMRALVRQSAEELTHAPKSLDPAEVEETGAFLKWIEDHHFTFLGMRDYELTQEKKETVLRAIPGTGYGLLRDALSQPKTLYISDMAPEARALTLSTHVLVVSKTHRVATVHRDAYEDYIGIKRFNAKGEVIGERRIIGLYTAAAYNTNPKHIPFLRHKVAAIMSRSMLSPRSHASKILLNILETLPRDELIQGSEEELLEMAMGIFYMQERRRIRLFARVDIYHRFVSCLVYVPRDRFNTSLRKAMQEILADNLHAEEITFSTYFSESVLARIHYLVRINPQSTTYYDFKAIEQKLVDVGRLWIDDLQQFLMEASSEAEANRLFARYRHVFPPVYTASFPARTAVVDIKHAEQLSADNQLVINFYRPLNESPENFKLKIYQQDTTIPLSDVLPIIENLGLRALTERPFELRFEDGCVVWINEFSLQTIEKNDFKIEEIKELFQTAFAKVWFGDAENDNFNQLILLAGLDWRQASILRAYAKYFKQTGFPFSQEYIERAVVRHAHIAKKLVALFELRFGETNTPKTEKRFEKLVNGIFEDLDAVDNLDEDKIIRQYVHVMMATLRTNYYQTESLNGQKQAYLAFKINSKEVPGLPKPFPLYEIFVYSPRFEGIHLRSSKVARGGLRWSDRKEDYRTEVLGLMKAQQVKNAVIVPSGAKGGFVLKRDLSLVSREELMAEGIACYQQFIRGLLDITDNLVDSAIKKPAHVVCYDEPDPYLVVAADKGTATFSDIANEISLQYGFWLSDAFASGGSIGYDHKKMGITARGAWESVKRHFYELGTDVQTTAFTVVGVGDMSGDVFGNGMLLSQHIQLIAAFNHQHIFIDPSPDAAASFKERQRLFDLPRSSWTDYDKQLISKGGGVFNRHAKSIAVSAEMKKLFDLKVATIEPNELIKMILKARYDLLWSAGIGTFVKARAETHAEVGDRTNDAIRVNAADLRCRVVGEGGNLGLTQLARIEYTFTGGLVYTDFIDNSGGVSCSDKEVNIKILLNSMVVSGDMTMKQRNTLLASMTQDVAQLVLRENYSQTRAISMSVYQGLRNLDWHVRFMNELERVGKLDRKLEFLPDDKLLTENKLLGRGLSAPSVAVLLCYSKISLKEQILSSNVPEDPFLRTYLASAFPQALLDKKFNKALDQHPLKREIIATRLSNLIVNEMGSIFVFRLQEETGASIAVICSAYLITRHALRMDETWKKLESLDRQLDADKQHAIAMIYMRLLRRLTRWVVRMTRTTLDITQMINFYQPGIDALKKSLPRVLGPSLREQFEVSYAEYLAMDIPSDLATDLTTTHALFAAMDIIEVAHELNISIEKTAEAYFGVGECLDLTWIRTQIIIHMTENHWEALSREALRDDLDWQQRQLTAALFSFHKKKDVAACLATWSEQQHQLIERWQQVLVNLKASTALNYTMFFVAIRELSDLTQTTIHLTDHE